MTVGNGHRPTCGAAWRGSAAVALSAHLDRHLDGLCRAGRPVTSDCERETPGIGLLVQIATTLSALRIPAPRQQRHNRESLLAAIDQLDRP